ncbi:MAG TPA: nucleoside triphosphate pyrophosphohydrolase [Chloroflexia bacterium]|nr:nucleoside triphosphate pyrophosphohydrolase [Chloroflexia bacterium]
MSSRKIIIVGLGPGDPGQLTVGALQVIQQTSVIYLRTAKHPTVPHLPAGTRLESFDDIYDREATFSEVYNTIVGKLIELAHQAGNEPVVYAVPGHPLVGESSVVRLLARAREENIQTEVVSSLSFIEPVCVTVGVDPMAEGMVILDATELAEQGELSLPREKGYELPILRPLIVGQIYNQRLASAVKLALMENYPDDHSVVLLRGAGIPGEEGRLDIPLYELDRHPEWTDHLTCAYLPPLKIEEALGTFENARYIIARLRAPEGCEWDRQQTHASLKRHLIEEAYEVVHALDEEPDKLPEEMGDLLLQIMLHAQIASEEGEWNMNDVLSEMAGKLIRRHPQIFDTGMDLQEGQPLRWEHIKQAEKAARGEEESSVLAGVPRSMPALQQAQALQRKAGEIGFVWRKYDQIIDKLVEEVAELRNITNHEELVEEFGDVLSVMASAAQGLKVDAEEALRLANNKFLRRFMAWEQIVKERQLDPHQMDLPGLQEIWLEARRRVD